MKKAEMEKMLEAMQAKLATLEERNAALVLEVLESKKALLEAKGAKKTTQKEPFTVEQATQVLREKLDEIIATPAKTDKNGKAYSKLADYQVVQVAILPAGKAIAVVDGKHTDSRVGRALFTVARNKMVFRKSWFSPEEIEVLCDTVSRPLAFDGDVAE